MSVGWVVYLSNRIRFPCLHSLIQAREGLREFETIIMQTRDEVHNCRILPTSRVFISGYANTEKKVSYCVYKITSSKNYNAAKDRKNDFIDHNLSSYNIDLTMAFLNRPIKTYILKIWCWRVYNSRIFTCGLCTDGGSKQLSQKCGRVMSTFIA